MDSKKLLKRLTFLILFILVANFLATNFYWYFTIKWLDMPMHFLGGVWLGLALLWLFRIKTLSLKTSIYILLGVLLIGSLWEVYEIIVNNNFAQNPFDLADTIIDLGFDLLGGVVALFYFYKRIMSGRENNIQ